MLILLLFTNSATQDIHRTSATKDDPLAHLRFNYPSIHLSIYLSIGVKTPCRAASAVVAEDDDVDKG